MFSLKSEKRWIIVALTIIVLLSTAINIYSVVKYNNYFLLGELEKADNDDVKYIRSAWTLFEKGIFTYHDINKPTVYIMPGHPLILTGLTIIFGKLGSIIAFRLFQVFLQALSLLLVFFIGRKIFNNLIGIIACFINALYPPEYFATGTILTEVTFKFLFLLLVYLSIFALVTKKNKYFISFGLVWGIACLIRPTVALFPIVILLSCRLFKYSFKDIVRFTCVASLIFITVLSPWWIRNYLVFERFIPLTLSSGNPFLQGTYINYDQSIDPVFYTPSDDVTVTNEIEMKTGIYRLKTYFMKQPLKYIHWYTIGKSWHLWKSPFYWKIILGISTTAASIYHYFIMISSLLGIAISLKQKNILVLFAISSILYFNLVHLPFYTFSRYSYPLMPLLIIICANAVFCIIRQVILKNYAT